MSVISRIGWKRGRHRWPIIAVAAVVILAMGLVLSLKTFEALAVRKADRIMQSLVGETRQETTLNVARWAVDNFDTRIKSPSYFRYAFLLSHRYMPEFLRTPRGAVDIFAMSGQCSNLSRTLEFLFSRVGIEAVQHDLIGPKKGHSALSVRLENEWSYIDPFSNVVFVEDNRLISLERLQDLARQGHAPETFAVSLRSENEFPVEKRSLYTRQYRELFDFYKRDVLVKTHHGRMGQPIEIEIELPFAGDRVTIGQMDGSWTDVLANGGRNGVSTHLHYVGPRYSRNFEFRLVAAKEDAPSGFRAIFHLIDTVDSDNIPKSNVPAKVGVRTLTYETANSTKGIKLHYGDMKWTLKNLLRQRSWYNVDMVEFVPL